MRRFFKEVIRRKVIPVAVAYAIGGWVLLQVGDVLIGLLELPAWTGKVLVAGVAAGFLLALLLSWVYDWTPKGIVLTKDTSTDADTLPKAFEFSEPKPVDFDALKLAPPDPGELIGRHAECDTLRQCLRSAKDGVGGIVLIGGEPGVGKSRLGEETLAIGRDMGLLPLTGHAYEDRSVPFITSSEILEEIIQVLPVDTLGSALGNAAPEMAKLLPELRRVFPGIPESTELPPEQQQRFLFNAVLEFLTRLGRCCPVVMLFDDLHWADESSISLFEHLAPHVRQLPILMVGTYRDVESDLGEPFKRMLASMSRETFVTRIALRRFNRDDVLSMMTVLSGQTPPPSIVDAIFEETDGNAFFVQSVYEHLTDEGRLFDADGNWLTGIDSTALDVPDSVRLVTGRRIARLRQETQDMLKAAAVIGLRFRVPVLEAAVGDDVLDSIEEAEAAHLVKRSSGKRELRYEFVHALARYTVLDAISALRRQKLHLLVVDAIERVRAKDLDAHAADLAFHLVEAGSYADLDKTLHWLQIAGRNAEGTAAMDEAVAFYDTALSMASDQHSVLRGDLLQSRASARLGLGDGAGAATDLQEAVAAYEAAGENGQAVTVTAHLANVLIIGGRRSDALQAIRHAESLIGDEDSPEKSRLLSAQGMAYGMSPEPENAAQLHADAVAMASRFDDRQLLVDVVQMQALDFHWQMYGDLGVQAALESASMRRELNQDWHLVQCLWMAKFSLVFAGRFDECSSLDKELIPLAERQGDSMGLAISTMLTGLVEQSRGNLDLSSKELEKAVELFESGGAPWGRPYQCVNLELQGRDEEARQWIDRFDIETLSDSAWDGGDTGYWLCDKAWLGDEDILEIYRKYQHHLPVPGATTAGGRIMFTKGAIEALILAGEAGEAARLYPIMADFVARDISKYGFALGLHERFAGMAAAAAKDWDSAERHFQHSLHVVDDELPHRVDQARVRYWYARMLLDRNSAGDKDHAGRLLDEARSLSKTMGMHGLIRRINSLAISDT